MSDPGKIKLEEVEGKGTQEQSLGSFCGNLKEDQDKNQTLDQTLKVLDQNNTEQEIGFGTDGNQTPFKVNTFVKFVNFMKMINCDKIAYKNMKEFKIELNFVLIWFHKNHTGKNFENEMPPKIAGLDICLFDLLKLVNGMGGYNMVTLQQEWSEVAMGFGYPEEYEMNFRIVYENYLSQAVLFYELAKDDTVFTVGTPDGLGVDVGGLANMTGDHSEWYVDHIKAIADEEEAVTKFEDNNQKNKTSKDQAKKESHEPDAIITEYLEGEGSRGTYEESDDFLIIT